VGNKDDGDDDGIVTADGNDEDEYEGEGELKAGVEALKAVCKVAWVSPGASSESSFPV